VGVRVLVDGAVKMGMPMRVLARRTFSVWQFVAILRRRAVGRRLFR